MKSFYDHVAVLDRSLSLRNPSEEDLHEVRSLIASSESLRSYFYTRLTEKGDDVWFDLLRRAGEIDILGTTADPPSRDMWAEASYTASMLVRSPNEVITRLRQINVTSEALRALFVESIAKLPTDIAADAADLVSEYFAGRTRKRWLLHGENAAKLMVKLIDDGRKEGWSIAEQLVEAWFEVPEEKRYLTDLQAKFAAHEYHELLSEYYKTLCASHPFEAARGLLRMFQSCVRDTDEKTAKASVFVGRMSVENLDSLHDADRNIYSSIVRSICESGREVLRAEANRSTDLLDIVRESQAEIFLRIEMHLLRFTEGNRFLEKTHEILGNKTYRQHPYTNEYMLLLRDKFSEVGDTLKEEFLKWVDEKHVYTEEVMGRWFGDNRPKDEDIPKMESRHKAELLYPVRECSPQYKTAFQKYLKESDIKESQAAPEPPVSRATYISPSEGSPLSKQEVSDMTPKEVIDFACETTRWKGKTKQDAFVVNTPEEGLAGAIQEDIEERPQDYLATGAEELLRLTGLFRKRAFYGLYEAATKKRIIPEHWSAILALAKLVTDEEFSSNTEIAEPNLSAMLDLLGKALDKDGILMEQSEENIAECWGIASKLVKYGHQAWVAVLSSQDPYTEARNSVSGKALELVLKLSTAARDISKEFYDEKFASQLLELLDYVVALGKPSDLEKPPLASIIGVYYSVIHSRHENWVKQRIDQLFSETNESIWNPVWGSYAAWGRPSEKGFKLLKDKGKYDHALTRLSLRTGYKFSREPSEGVAEHLMIAFYQGWINYEDQLMQDFFAKANDDLRAYAAQFLSTGFDDIRSNPKNKAEKIGRLKGYWRDRLEAIRVTPDQSIAEATKLATWFEDSPFEKKETLELLLKTLKVTGGRIELPSDFLHFADKIRGIMDADYRAALDCLLLVAKQRDVSVGYFRRAGQNTLSEMFDTILRLPRTYDHIKEIWTKGKELADELGRRQVYDYRTYYERLDEMLSDS